MLLFNFSAFEAFDNLKNKTKIRPTEWELQKGYDTKNPKAYPFRAPGSGENGGLKFEIWRKFSEVKESTNFNKGFKMVVHLPGDVPQFDKQYYRFPLEKSATLVLRPSLIDTEKHLQSINFKTRQCYFDHEKNLQFFNNYTRSNCQLECLAQRTQKHCGCIHYSMPRLKGDLLCDKNQSACFEEAKKLLMKENMEESLSTSETYDDRGELACGCLPACTSLQYEGEISHDDIRYFGKYKNSE